MNDDRYIAALEISSSKIIGTIGRTHGAGQLDVIAVEQEKGVECVRYGIIQNLEETYLRAARVLDRLERRPAVSPKKISGLFVGLSGRSVRSISTEVSLNLPEDTEITDEILEQLEKQALSTGIDSSLEVIDAIPRKFIVGKNPTQSPKGAVGDHISAVYDLIVCRPVIKRNIERVVTGKLGLSLKGVVVTAMASGHLILTDEEKRQGCMLVDLGAETTTVTIYKDGHLQYFATLPLGGRNITRDITSLSVLEEKAEEIKLNAVPDGNLNINGIRQQDVAQIILARSEEIIINIIQQIHYAGLKEKDLHGGIVCIGGGASMNGFLEILEEKSCLPTRIGRLPAYVRTEDAKAATPEAIEAISILYAGATKSNLECLEDPKPRELPEFEGDIPEETEERNEEKKKEKKPARPSWLKSTIGKISEGLGNFFATPDEDDSDELM